MNPCDAGLCDVCDYIGSFDCPCTEPAVCDEVGYCRPYQSLSERIAESEFGDAVWDI